MVLKRMIFAHPPEAAACRFLSGWSAPVDNLVNNRLIYTFQQRRTDTFRVRNLQPWLLTGVPVEVP